MTERWCTARAGARPQQGSRGSAATARRILRFSAVSRVWRRALEDPGAVCGVRRRVRGACAAHAPHSGSARAGEVLAVTRVAERMLRWMRRRKMFDQRPAEERSNEAPEVSPLEACMQLSLMGGLFLRLTDRGEGLAEGDEERRLRGVKKSPWTAEVDGMNIHAGVTMRAGDREGLERLLRYCARPAFSLERLSQLADGRLAYELRRPRKNGATHLVLTPVQLIARIAAIVPPPRYPLSRFAGVLAPSSPWRASIVPSRSAPTKPGGATKAGGATKPRESTSMLPDASSPATAAHVSTPAPTAVSAPAPLARTAKTSLGAGLPPVYARVDWASLLRRVYLEDVLACPCGGRRRVVADVTERAEIAAYLEKLGLPTEAPPLARARSPSFEAA